MIKYLTVCNKITPAMVSCLNEIPRRGGFYNWMFLFRGEIATYDSVEDFEKYDVIHVNAPPADQILIPEIRKKIGTSSSTKIVLNNDYVAETWDAFGQHPLQYLQIQRQADMVFATEPYQTSHMIDNCYCMPHPHWIHMLKRIGRPQIQESIGYLYHWWEAKSYLPYIWSYKLRELGIKHRTRLYAYSKDQKDKNKMTRAMYDELIEGMTYPDYIEHIIKNKLVVEYSGYHTYGRNTVDLAAIGVPVVGSDRVESMRRCFPKISHDPVDAKSIVNSIKRLWTDEKFYDEVVEFAAHQVEYYNYKNSKERFMTALEESSRMRR